jgi:hypothetical protein
MSGNGDRLWLFRLENKLICGGERGGNNFELERERYEWSHDVLSVFRDGKKEEGH